MIARARRTEIIAFMMRRFYPSPRIRSGWDFRKGQDRHKSGTGYSGTARAGPRREFVGAADPNEFRSTYVASAWRGFLGWAPPPITAVAYGSGCGPGLTASGPTDYSGCKASTILYELVGSFFAEAQALIEFRDDAVFLVRVERPKPR